MEQLFYLVVNGKQSGPFTILELSSKNIQRDTLVWTQGFDSWTKAEYIPLLKEVIKMTPPPIPNTQNESNSHSSPPPPIPQTSSGGNHFGFTLARRRDRFFASLLEGIIISIPTAFIFGTEIYDDPYNPSSIFGWTFVSALYGAILYPIWSGNLGHRILGLKVISIEDGQEQNKAGAGAMREGLKSISGLIFFPLIWLLWDDNRQNLYDKITKTIVVKKV